jgi:L-amino acid N-acyltransferase YncA
MVKSLTALALVAGLGVSVPSVAFASSATHASTSSSTAWTAFRAQWKTYVQGLESIRTTYRTSVQDARATYQAALEVATDRTERQAARATLDASLVTALSARVSMITSAGDPPSPPAGYNGTAWVTSFQGINVSFRAAVGAAQTTFSVALASATTASQREAARGAYETSVGEATSARASSLTTLGPPPSNPGQPA